MHQIRNNRGSASLRVVCGILGSFSILFGVVMVVVSFALLMESVTDHDLIWAGAFFILLAAVMIAEGIFMFVLPARIDQATRGTSRSSVAAPTSPTPHAPNTRYEGPHDSVVEDSSQDEKPAEQREERSARQSSADDETARMILRSDDIFATAKDLIHMRHTKPANARKFTHFASMLEAAGVDLWESAPTCSVTKLGRTGNYWVRANTDEMSPEEYDRFMAAEAALNLDLALPELASKPLEDVPAMAKVCEYMRGLFDQDIRTYDFDKSLGRAYPGVRPEATPGEWFARASIMNDAECVVLPFRLIHNLRMNVETRTAVLNIEIPRPSCFGIIIPGRSNQVSMARAYALRVSWLLASHAFKNLPELERVEVLCHDHGSTDTLLAVDYTPLLVRRLLPTLRSTDIEGQSFPHDDAIVATFDSKGWFAPVEAPLPFASELVAPSSWFIYPELDERELSPHCAEVTGAKRVRDLAINENGPRVQAADALIERWRSLDQRSCENVVATLVDMRNSTTNVSIAEACDRATTALLNGSVDPTDDDELRSILISDGALQVAVSRAAKLLDNEDHADPEQAITVLREALDPILSFGFYADDESCVYRYFGSVAERMSFNTRIDDHTREVRLVPDSYYNALSFLSSAYTTLGQNVDAARIADEMMRIAPASMDAVMRKVRALENDSRVFEAAELIKSRTPLAITPRDAALAHYRLAYMEWKLGREDLACACYQRALTWDTNLSEQARGELNDLIDSYPELTRMNADEVSNALSNADIPLGFTKADQDLILVATTLLVDEHVFMIAVPLLSILCAAEGDDVLVSIRRTLVR